MEMDKIYFGSARTSDEKIEELARIRQYLRSNSVDEKVLIRLQELAEADFINVRMLRSSGARLEYVMLICGVISVVPS